LILFRRTDWRLNRRQHLAASNGKAVSDASGRERRERNANRHRNAGSSAQIGSGRHFGERLDKAPATLEWARTGLFRRRLLDHVAKRDRRTAVTLAMLNSEIPGIHSGRTPFYSRTLSESYKHFFHGSRTKGGRTMLFGSAEDFQPDGTLRGHWVPHGEGWMPVAESEALDMVSTSWRRRAAVRGDRRALIELGCRSSGTTA
jgi:hypothetical protein